MVDERDTEAGERKARQDAWRTAQLFALLMAAIVAFNVLLYINRRTTLPLVVAVVAAVVLVAWLVYARRVIDRR